MLEELAQPGQRVEAPRKSRIPSLDVGYIPRGTIEIDDNSQNKVCVWRGGGRVLTYVRWDANDIEGYPRGAQWLLIDDLKAL